MWGSESCTTIIIFPFGHLSDRERTATGREHNPHTTEPSIDCQHRKYGFLLSRSKRQTSFLLLSVADRIVGNRAREQYSDCYLLSERRSRWPGRSAGCRPVPSNRARQKARQPASPRPRTRSSNPNGLLASSNCKANIARARQLMAAPMAEVDPPALHDTADPDATTDHRPPCPCCGGRMIIVEVFARGAAPRGPPSGAGIQT